MSNTDARYQNNSRSQRTFYHIRSNANHWDYRFDLLIGQLAGITTQVQQFASVLKEYGTPPCRERRIKLEEQEVQVIV